MSIAKEQVIRIGDSDPIAERADEFTTRRMKGKCEYAIPGDDVNGRDHARKFSGVRLVTDCR